MKRFIDKLTTIGLFVLMLTCMSVLYGRFGYVIDDIVPQTGVENIVAKVDFDRYYETVENGTQEDIDADKIIYKQGSYYHHNTKDFVDLINSVADGETVKINGKYYEVIERFPGNAKVKGYNDVLGVDVGVFYDSQGNRVNELRLGIRPKTYIITCNNDENYNRFFVELEMLR